MSKTFKSVTDNTSELDVRANDCGVFIAFSRAGQIRQASTFAPSDAPALALAILEAAGVEPKMSQFDRAGTQEQLEAIADGLVGYIEANKASTAEAKEQAELEAEALELYNARILFLGGEALTSFEKLNQDNKDMWLAVVRKAREMSAEK